MNEPVSIKTLRGMTKWGHGRIYDDITQTIGNTPIVRLLRMAAAANCNANILLKLEFLNPLSSVKDRIAVSMVDALEESGRINADSVVIEATNGNTGISLACVCAVRGYRLILIMPEPVSMETRKMIAHLGAELEMTPAIQGMQGAILRAGELTAEFPGSVQTSQFENPANPDVHAQTTAEEIWNDTGGDLDVIVAGIGTGGTVTGCGRELKSRKEDIRVAAVEPSESSILTGGMQGPHKIMGIGAGFVPDILDQTIIDEVVKVPSATALQAAKTLAKIEGIPAGISTGANLAAALTIGARTEMAGKNILTFAPSFAERYYSTALFEDSRAGWN